MNKGKPHPELITIVISFLSRIKTKDAKIWQMAQTNPQCLVEPRGIATKFLFITLAPQLPKSVILQDDRLPKFCPINKLLVSPSYFSLQAMVHL